MSAVAERLAGATSLASQSLEYVTSLRYVTPRHIRLAIIHTLPYYCFRHYFIITIVIIYTLRSYYFHYCYYYYAF